MKYPVALFAALALTLSAQAQWTPPTPAQMAQHELSHYSTLLTLSSEQQEQATSLFTEEASSSQTLRASERAAHKALETAIENNDTAAIQQTSATLGQLNGELTALHATTRAKFYALLSADQKTKYTALEHEHRGGPGGPGPGGPPPGL
jgi:Spy/CpxP family protein refolding chaperone